MSDTETSFSTEKNDGVGSQDFTDPEEQLFLEDLEEARLAEHALAIRDYVAAAELETRGTELDSDEELSIIRNIREEITRQVRQEMAEQGEDVGAAAAATATAAEEAPPDNAEFLAAMDPRLKEELERMRKLDKVLLRKMRREREVKRSRMEQERRFREELRQLDESAGSGGRDGGSKLAKDVRNNMLKFMALKPPPKHNAGVYSEDSPPPTPVFQTEYLDGQGGRETESNERRSEGGASSNVGPEGAAKRRSSGAQGPKPKPDKDFIKRNIELAGMASEVVAMTEEERVRLDALLSDLDALPPSFESSAEETPDFTNPFKVAVKPGEGYSLDADLRQRMNEIDSRLSRLMPPGDLDSLPTPSADSDSMSYQPSLYLRMQLEPNFDLDQLGEEALKEVKAKRDLDHRLESIDSGLESLRAAHEAEEVPMPHLDGAQLGQLLGQCVRSLSRSTATCTPSLTHRSEGLVSEVDSEAALLDSERTEASELEAWLQNPPRLERSVLLQLLEESRSAGVGTAYLPALPEAESETETLQNGDTSRTSISTFTDDPQSFRRLTSRASLATDLRSDSDSDSGASPSPSPCAARRRASAGARDNPAWPQLPGGRPNAEASSDSAKEERLVLPDINMYANMTAPKRPS